MFYPSSSLEITFPKTKQKFCVEADTADKAGVYTISYGLGGPSEVDFEMPEPNSFLVEPRVTISDSVLFQIVSC